MILAIASLMLQPLDVVLHALFSLSAIFECTTDSLLWQDEDISVAANGNIVIVFALTGDYISPGFRDLFSLHITADCPAEDVCFDDATYTSRETSLSPPFINSDRPLCAPLILLMTSALRLYLASPVWKHDIERMWSMRQALPLRTSSSSTVPPALAPALDSGTSSRGPGPDLSRCRRDQFRGHGHIGSQRFPRNQRVGVHHRHDGQRSHFRRRRYGLARESVEWRHVLGCMPI